MVGSGHPILPTTLNPKGRPAIETHGWISNNTHNICDDIVPPLNQPFLSFSFLYSHRNEGKPNDSKDGSQQPEYERENPYIPFPVGNHIVHIESHEDRDDEKQCPNRGKNTAT